MQLLLLFSPFPRICLQLLLSLLLLPLWHCWRFFAIALPPAIWGKNLARGLRRTEKQLTGRNRTPADDLTWLRLWLEDCFNCVWDIFIEKGYRKPKIELIQFIQLIGRGVGGGRWFRDALERTLILNLLCATVSCMNFQPNALAQRDMCIRGAESLVCGAYSFEC